MAARFNLLVVEDDAAVQEQLCAALARADIAIRKTQDGGQAAALLRSEKYDLVVLDVRLPSMNGLQVAAIARSGTLNRASPIFIVTGMLDDATVARAKALRVSEVVEKPLDFAVLAQRIHKRLDDGAKPPSYDARIINTFVESASEIYEYYFKAKPDRGRPGIKAAGTPARGAISGLIGFTGDGFVGSMALSVNVPFIKGLAEAVFPGMDVKLDNEIAADMVGEMCNQVLGTVKTKFAKLGRKVALGLPKVVIGKNHVIYHTVKNPVLFIPIGKGNVGCDIEFCLDQRTIKINEAEHEEHKEGGSVMLFD